MKNILETRKKYFTSEGNQFYLYVYLSTQKADKIKSISNLTQVLQETLCMAYIWYVVSNVMIEKDWINVRKSKKGKQRNKNTKIEMHYEKIVVENLVPKSPIPETPVTLLDFIKPKKGKKKYRRKSSTKKNNLDISMKGVSTIKFEFFFSLCQVKIFIKC